MNVIEASGLGKRYGGTWALRECSLAIPAGHVAALVGPNGAGKTTLLNLAAPSAGGVTVLGGRPAGSPAALDGIAFVAQDTPLYKNLCVADILHLTRNLNRRFDQAYAHVRLAELGIPLKRKAGRLSGGQQAQLALTLALARRPRLLLLDEPVAMLDPVARHDFMATVLTAMADDGVSVVLSSHVLADLERVADYLILLSRGGMQLAGEADDLLAGHRMLTGPTAEADGLAGRLAVVHARRAGAFAGAPVLAREMETGTFRYAWTQGFGRWRWALGAGQAGAARGHGSGRRRSVQPAVVLVRQRQEWPAVLRVIRQAGMAGIDRSGRLVSLRPTGALNKRIAQASGIMHHGQRPSSRSADLYTAFQLAGSEPGQSTAVNEIGQNPSTAVEDGDYLLRACEIRHSRQRALCT